MAIVNGPLLSLDASGKVAGAIVFSKWKGRPVVRQLVKPSNPRSAAQWGQRSMLRFLSVAWAGQSAGNKATWLTLAEAGKYSEFNAFVHYNLKRWTQWNDPLTTPSTAAGTVPVMGALTLTGGVRQFTVSQIITTANQIWGVDICMSGTTGFTPAKSNTRYVALYAASPVTAIITGLAAGTYYVRTAGFTTGGSRTAFVAEQSVVVT
jgi:hypothetical protein